MPEFIFNEVPGAMSNWRHVETAPAPPSASFDKCVSLKLMSMGLQSVLRAALLHGVSMTKAQIEDCIEAEEVDYPSTGSGKGGRVLVYDLAKALVESVLVNEDEAVQLSAIKKLSKGRVVSDESEGDVLGGDLDGCPQEILQILSQLDVENREHFKHVSEQAAKLLEKRAKKEQSKGVKRKAQELIHEQEQERKKRELEKQQERQKRELDLGQDLPARQVDRSAPKASGAPRAPKEPVPKDVRGLFPHAPGQLFVRFKPDSKISVEFKGLEQFVQRTRSLTWTATATLDHKATLVGLVLDFVSHTYHRHCKDWESYDRTWTVPSEEVVKDVLRSTGE